MTVIPNPQGRTVRESVADPFAREQAARAGIPLPPDYDAESVAQEAERIVSGPRRDAYGPVEESFTRVADLWSTVLDIEVSPQQVAAMMVLLKISRELGGSPQRDNLVDICGYALLWDRLNKVDGEG